MTDDLPIRLGTEADHAQLSELFATAFLHDVDEEGAERHRLVYEPDRTHLIEDEGRPVATAAVFTRDMTVPGGVIPAAHVTAVSVAGSHRRRGLLARLMHTQLGDIKERYDEPIAVLWASEGSIYGRYGYGIAAQHAELSMNRTLTQVAGPAPAGRLSLVTPSEAVKEMAAVFDRVRVGRPGWSSRPGKWWDRQVSDVKSRPDGMSKLRGAVYREDGAATGYALWRVKGGWESDGPNGSVKVVQVVAASSGAYRGLWRFLLSIDLTRSVEYVFGATDEPIGEILTDPGAVVVTSEPSLWVRVVDVPAALSARRYAAPMDLVVEISDELLPENAGRWRVQGDRAAASCERTTQQPDLIMDVRQLGAIYLGGTSPGALAEAGAVAEVRAGSVAEAAAGFGWHRAPSAIEIF